MSQLDAWRGIAVIVVILQHFFPWSLKIAPFGQMGVRVFFVLSGFLVTGILLRCRKGIERGQPALWTLRQFYIRRILRIFPLYYFCLVVALLAGLAGMEVHGLRGSILWHFTYTSNFYFAKIADWGGVFFHFWSLAVTEQFYLFWPWVVLMLPRRALAPAIIGTIVIGLGWRIYASVMDIDFFLARCMPIGAWAALGTGGLLALIAERSPQIAPSWKPLWQLAPWTALLLFGIGVFRRVGEGLPITDMRLAKIDLTMDVSSLLFSIWAIRGAAMGFRGPGSAILGFRPLLYVGTISYGLYIFHPFLIRAVRRAQESLGAPWDNSLLGLLMLAGAAIGWCAACWHLFESPINNLKRLFPYKRKA